MKRFDEKFAQQVKQAFGSYNADHLVDAGWNALQQKQGKSNRFGIIVPFWAKAASITVLLAVGSFVTYRISEKSIEPIISESIAPVVTDSIQSKIAPITTSDSSEKIAESKKVQPIVKREVNPSFKQEKSALSEDILTQPEVLIIDSSATTHQEYIAENQEKDTAIPEKEDIPVETAAPITESEKPVVAQILNEPEEESGGGRKTSLSAGFSGMMARVENLLSSAPGVSVGLYAQHQLSNRIAVRPGLALAKHSYAMESNNIASTDYSAPEVNGMAGEVVSAENHMDIIAMEIPVNFVFDLVKKRDKTFFVSAGASTMIYLNQHFTGTYLNSYSDEVFNSETGEWDMATNFTTVNIDNEYGAFSRTDFFGLANLSAGYLFPLGKNSMLIEPFIQIPVRNITSSDLRISFGGISLKYILKK